MKASRRFARALALCWLAASLSAGPGAAAPNAPDGPALVVLAFDGPADDRDFSGELLADLLTTHLGKEVPVVERAGLDKILAEQRLSRGGLVRDDEAVQIGKLVGARFLLAGRVFRPGDDTHVTVRLVSVE